MVERFIQAAVITVSLQLVIATHLVNQSNAHQADTSNSTADVVAVLQRVERLLKR